MKIVDEKPLKCSGCGSNMQYLNTIFKGIKPIGENYMCVKCGKTEIKYFE